MTEPRAMPRVLAAWRAVAGEPPQVTARCASCGRVIGHVYDSAMGALLHYFEHVSGRAVNVTVAPEHRDLVHRLTTEEMSEHYGIAKWDKDGDRVRLSPLEDDCGWLAILDRDDYWVPGDWSCEKHGSAPVDRAMLMDRFRRARSSEKTWDERVPLGAASQR